MRLYLASLYQVITCSINLIYILRRKEDMRKKYLEELLQLTKQQQILIMDEKVEEFIEIIEKRQSLLDQIEILNEEQGSILDEEEKIILMEIQRVDQENRVEYDRQFEEVKSQLRKLRELKKREENYNSIYGVANMEEGIFFDKGDTKWKSY